MKMEQIHKINELSGDIKSSKERLKHINWLSDFGRKYHEIVVDTGLDRFKISVDLKPAISILNDDITSKTRKLIELGVEL